MGNHNVVGDQVRRLRSAKGWSQEELAAACQRKGWDISRGTFSKIEADLRRVTDAEVFVLSKVLEVQLIDLYPAESEVLKAVRNP